MHSFIQLVIIFLALAQQQHQTLKDKDDELGILAASPEPISDREVHNTLLSAHLEILHKGQDFRQD